MIIHYNRIVLSVDINNVVCLPASIPLTIEKYLSAIEMVNLSPKIGQSIIFSATTKEESKNQYESYVYLHN